MLPVFNHPWNLPEDKALEIQKNLAAKVVKENNFNEINYVAGVDVAYKKNSDAVVAAVLTLDAYSLEIVESATVECTVHFPYIPSLFSFREIPPLIKAFAKLKITPDLIVCDGQGLAHPRRFGIACHLGVLYDIPTIGCGKSRLFGTQTMPENKKGATAPLIANGDIIGSVLRTQLDVNPIYVSIGHKISLVTSCEWIMKLTTRYRLPETTRQADHLAKIFLKN